MTALEALNILEQFAASRVSGARRGPAPARSAIGRAFTDRFEHLGDPSFVKAPWNDWSPRRTRGTWPRRFLATRAVVPLPRRTHVPAPADCTTHISVIDGQRNMVALTHTAVSLWGSRVVVPARDPAEQRHDLVRSGDGQEQLGRAGKRASQHGAGAGVREGPADLTLGAPGGRTIISAIPQVSPTSPIAADVVQAAIDAPRLHTEVARCSSVIARSRGGGRAGRRGHTVVLKEETYSTLNFARPVAVRVTPKGLEDGADAYSAAAAAGG